MSIAIQGAPPSKPRRTRKNNRRLEILAVAEGLLETKGLGAVTTRAIAEAVPCSEGAIYVHFDNRLQLILTVFEQALAAMLEPLRGLETAAGTGTPRTNLVRAATALSAFHTRVAPMLCSMFAEAELLQAFRAALTDGRKGPQGAAGRVAAYVRAEQRLGRIGGEVDAEFVAASLLAGSFFAAFHRALLGHALGALAPARLVGSLLREKQERPTGAALKNGEIVVSGGPRKPAHDAGHL